MLINSTFKPILPPSTKEINNFGPIIICGMVRGVTKKSLFKIKRVIFCYEAVLRKQNIIIIAFHSLISNKSRRLNLQIIKNMWLIVRITWLDSPISTEADLLILRRRFWLPAFVSCNVLDHTGPLMKVKRKVMNIMVCASFSFRPHAGSWMVYVSVWSHAYMISIYRKLTPNLQNKGKLSILSN